MSVCAAEKRMSLANDECRWMLVHVVQSDCRVERVNAETSVAMVIQSSDAAKVKSFGKLNLHEHQKWRNEWRTNVLSRC